MSRSRMRSTLNALDETNRKFSLPNGFLVVRYLETSMGDKIDNYTIIGTSLHTVKQYSNPVLDYYGVLDYLENSAYDEAFGFILASRVRPSISDTNLQSAQFFEAQGDRIFRSISNSAIDNNSEPFKTDKYAG